MPVPLGTGLTTRDLLDHRSPNYRSAVRTGVTDHLIRPL